MDTYSIREEKILTLIYDNRHSLGVTKEFSLASIGAQNLQHAKITPSLMQVTPLTIDINGSLGIEIITAFGPGSSNPVRIE